MFAEVQSNGIKSLDLGRQVLVTFFKGGGKDSRFWSDVFLRSTTSGVLWREMTSTSQSQKAKLWPDVFVRKCVYTYVCVCVNVNICICVHMDIHIYIYV